jgi:CRISPR-associated protein Cas1
VPTAKLGANNPFNYFGATPQLLSECASRKISVSFLTEYGKYLGTFHGESNGNVLLRRDQYRIADDKRALDMLRTLFLVNFTIKNGG